MPPKKPTRININDKRTSALVRTLAEDDAKRFSKRRPNMTETLYAVLLAEAQRRGLVTEATK